MLLAQGPPEAKLTLMSFRTNTCWRFVRSHQLAAIRPARPLVMHSTNILSHTAQLNNFTCILKPLSLLLHINSLHDGAVSRLLSGEMY